MGTTPVAPLEEPTGSARIPGYAGSVLYIDDNMDAAQALVMSLQRERWAIHHVTDVDAGLAYLQSATPEIIILDYVLPGIIGTQGVRVMHAAAPDIPIVVLSGHADAGVAVGAVEAGADVVISRAELLDRSSEQPAAHRVIARLVQVRARAQRNRGVQDMRPLLAQILVLLRRLVASTAPRVGLLDRIAALVPLLPPETARRLVGALASLAVAGIGYLVARIQAGSLDP